MRVWLTSIAIVALFAAWPSADRLHQTAAASAPPALSDAETERFLREAKVVRTKSIGKGVTGSVRATLTDGTLTHDAQIQTIEEKKTQFDAPGAAEFNFQDSWRFNVAAYRVDRLIGLNMVPVSVSRTWRMSPAAVTWWVDDVMMDEGKRLKDKVQPPNSALWNEQMQLVRVFDQLIYNVDRNIGNLLIGNGWRLWAIDHTRAFRMHDTLKSPANITRCDRQVLARMKELNREELKRSIGDFVTDYEINGLLARRDKIVALIEKAGPVAVFDRHSY
jgi:hypothetical protein